MGGVEVPEVLCLVEVADRGRRKKLPSVAVVHPLAPRGSSSLPALSLALLPALLHSSPLACLRAAAHNL